MPNGNGSNWLRCLRPRPAARMRLFCFPYAGGSSLIFNGWHEWLPPEVEVWAVVLPGREQRFGEPPVQRLETLLAALGGALADFSDKPFVFFGHSLGAIVCFELTRQLRHQYRPVPRHLFVSACRAPHLPDPNPPIHRLPLSELVKALGRHNDTMGPLLENVDLLTLFGPVLRADLSIFETYHHLSDQPLPCSISAFGGLADPKVDAAAIPPWEEQTSAQFRVRMFPGDHFFLNQQRHGLLAEMSEDLEQLLRA